MATKTITLDLSTKGINRALKVLEDFKKELIKKCNEVITILAQKGEEFAKMYIVDLGAVYTGELLDSITSDFDESTRIGRVYVNGVAYAAYVEYGTGIIGDFSPHPEPWAYDINNHGWDGWYFIGRDGIKYHTLGQPAHPFMYNTRRDLESICQSIVKGVFK